jgi:serine/threonine protein kinase
MPTKLGQFEILSELSKSPTGSVYKANDPESGQPVALKAIQLGAFGEHASAVEQALLQEVESVKVLTCQNLCCVGNTSVIDGQFCAPMEYVQGNSIATMLARNEGFSIWDLLDIGRQLCNGLDDASSHNIIHQSLEPSKIMCGWDGTVKILSYGVSSVGNFVQYVDGVSSISHYMSPEQLRGELTDLRSNLFSLGAIFYEMLTEQKAFDGADIESIRQNILESTPVAPIRINAKVHPLLSDLIMKALAKDPANRYATGRALLDDLENCKESKPAAKKTVAPNPSTVVTDTGARVAAKSKFVNSAVQHPQPAAAPQVSSPASAKVSASPVPKVTVPQTPRATTAPVAAKPAPATRPSRLAAPKTQAAAAGIGGSAAIPSHAPLPNSAATRISHSPADDDQPSAYMSSALSDEPQIETFEASTTAPKIAVDPLMAESAPGSSGTSFSEISELPPLKEVYVAPEPPPEIPTPQPPKFASTAYRGSQRVADKPKIQPREVAAKAIKEVKGVPPKLMLYAVGGAVILIVAIAIGVMYYIHGQSDEDTGTRRRVAPTAVQAPAQARPAPPEAAGQPQTPAEAQPAEISDVDSEPVTATSTSPRARVAKKKAVTPVVMPGQLSVDSTPQGAQIQLDGATDPSWVTPLALENVQPGKHSITVSKAGYATDTRTVDVASGAKAAAIVHLSQLSATLIVKSDPAGANIYIDSKDVGTKTPAQISVGKGQHLILVRKEGYLDETMNAQFVLGQTFNFSPTLRALGNVENMKTVGKMSKLFGKKGQADQGTISIHTQPKGAQIAINQHMLDKTAPVDVTLDPGNYVIDVTASGYAPIHKIITVERGSKALLEDVMQPQ